MTKCSSGVVVYMQATAASNRPGSVGSSARRWPAMTATSAGCTSRSIVSGVHGSPCRKNATFTPPSGPSIAGKP